MTNDPLESRPTADGELREDIDDLMYLYKVAENDAVRNNAIERVLHLIKQNTPSKESVSPPKHHTSKADDSSISDDDSLQSQPQHGQEWLTAQIKRYENEDAETIAADIQSHMQQEIQSAMLRQKAYDERQESAVLNGFTEWYNDKYDTGYESGIAESRVDEYLSSLTHLKQQQQERGSGGGRDE